MSLRGWEVLTCICGSKHFLLLHEISWHEQNGTSIKPHGYQCAGCRKTIATAELIGRAKDRHLRSQIEELEAQRG